MPYSYANLVDKTKLSDALNRPEYIAEVFQATAQQSSVMSIGRRLPNMTKGRAEMSVLDALPSAYFVNGETGLKKTTNQVWKGKTLTVGEIAAIVPFSEEVLSDTDVNIDDVGQRIGEAIGRVVDNAVIAGTNMPSTWLTDTGGTGRSILAGATAASQAVALGTGLDAYDDILGESGIYGLVEADGYEVNGVLAHRSMKAKLRHLRANRTDDGAGLPIFTQNGGTYFLDGVPVMFPKNGGVAAASVLMVVGDWSQIVYSIRQDVTFKLLTEGVITDDEGAIVYNLGQQDMVALRAVMRVAFQIANPVNPESETENSRYPFAVLTPASGS